MNRGIEGLPTGPDFRDLVTARSKIEIGKKSPINILSDLMIQEGREGILESWSRFEDFALFVSLDNELVQKLPEDKRKALFVNYSAIVFGVSATVIDGMLWQKEFNPDEWVSRYNLAKSGTTIPDKRVLKKHKKDGIVTIVKLPDDRWKSLLKIAIKDKSLAVFFKDRYNDLPEELRTYIDRTETLPYIKSAILPTYKERYRVATTK